MRIQGIILCVVNALMAISVFFSSSEDLALSLLLAIIWGWTSVWIYMATDILDKKHREEEIQKKKIDEEMLESIKWLKEQKGI